MKAEHQNRTIKLTEIRSLPDDIRHLNLPTELDIEIKYTDDGADRVSKAIILDHVIIPAILEALNKS